MTEDLNGDAHLRILTLLNGLQKVPTVKSPCLSHIFIESRGITKCQLPFPRRKGRVRFKKAQLPRLIFDDAGREGRTSRSSLPWETGSGMACTMLQQPTAL